MQNTQKIAVVLLIVIVGLVFWFRKPATKNATKNSVDSQVVVEEETTERATVSGTVTSKSFVSLPEKSNVQVELVDMTTASGKPVVYSGSNTITKGESLPIKFSIGYNNNSFKKNSVYVLNARVIIDGKITMQNSESYPVITNGGPTENITIEVEPVVSL